MKKEDYEKHMQLSYNGKQMVFNHLLIVTPKFRELMEKHGISCKRCKSPFIPQPHYRENFSNAPHYPTEDTCGFCVYDMDSYEHSQLLEESDYYPI